MSLSGYQTEHGEAPLHVVNAHVHYREPESVARPCDPDGPPSLTEPYSVEQVVSAAEAAGVDQVVQIVPTLRGLTSWVMSTWRRVPVKGPRISMERPATLMILAIVERNRHQAACGRA